MTETEKLAELLPQITPEFLHLLAELVKTCGWTVDHVESASFVRWCYAQKGMLVPDLEPYVFLAEDKMWVKDEDGNLINLAKASVIEVYVFDPPNGGKVTEKSRATVRAVLGVTFDRQAYDYAYLYSGLKKDCQEYLDQLFAGLYKE